MARKVDFYQSPARGIIAVIFGECPQRVKMVGHNDHCINGKGMCVFNMTDGCSEQINVSDKQMAFSLRQVDGEKVGCTRNFESSITHDELKNGVDWVNEINLNASGISLFLCNLRRLG